MKISVMRFSSERGTPTLHNGKALGGNHGGSGIFYLFLFILDQTDNSLAIYHYKNPEYT